MSEIANPSRRLEKLIDVLVIVTILVMPTQFGFNTRDTLTWTAEAMHLVKAVPQQAQEALAAAGIEKQPPTQAATPAPSEEQPTRGLQRLLERIPSANFTIADILIWILFVLWVVKICVYREFKVVRLWPLSIVALVVWAGVSLVQSWKPVNVTVDTGEGVKEMIQYAEYFIAGFIVFANAAGRDFALRRMAIAFWIATTGVILIAICQYLNAPGANLPLAKLIEPSADPLSVRGLFGDYNNYRGAYNVLGGYFALALPFMWGAALCEKNWFIRVWLAAATGAGIFVTMSGGAMAAILVAMLSITFIRGEKFFVGLLVAILLLGFFVWPRLPRQNGPALMESVRLYVKGAGWQWQQRYVEWQPALRAIAFTPVTGVGVGGYQRHIDQFYGLEEIAKPAGTNYMEPYAINGYAVLGVSAGVPALMALIWIILDFRRRAWSAYSGFEYGMEKSIGLGVYGALTGFTIVMFFTNIFLRGLGVAFIMLLALAAAAGRQASEEPPPKDEEGAEKKTVSQ